MKSLFTCFILSIITGGYSQFSIQNVVLEMYTGAWSQYSPDGVVILNDVLLNNPNVIGIGVHSGDGMEVLETTELTDFYSPLFPTATINRDGTIYARNLWSGTCATMTSGVSSVTVSFDSVLYNSATRLVDVYLNALFTGPLTGDLRFNCVVVEDSVTGTGTGYDQVNYYNLADPGHPYYGAGNPIIGFPHRMVARTYLGGTWGTSGVIPASVNFGMSVSHHYSCTLPLNFDEHQIYLVGIVSRYDGAGIGDREILNAAQTTLGPIYYAEIENETEVESFQLFPNPATSSVFISSGVTGVQKLEITDQLGRVVLHSEINVTGTEPFNINIEDLTPGVYYIRLGNQSKRLIKI